MGLDPVHFSVESVWEDGKVKQFTARMAEVTLKKLQEIEAAADLPRLTIRKRTDSRCTGSSPSVQRGNATQCSRDRSSAENGSVTAGVATGSHGFGVGAC